MGNDWVCPFEKEEDDDPEAIAGMEKEVVGRPGVGPLGAEEEVEAEAIKALWLALGIAAPPA